jgi:hypothetical protein
VTPATNNAIATSPKMRVVLTRPPNRTAAFVVDVTQTRGRMR